mgnify:CR=1 FL=1|jgi:tape measure domain-containing protein
MATIKTVLSIQDAMTKPLRSINRAMNLVISSMEQMQKATRKPVDTKALKAARDELAKMGAAIDDIEEKTERAGNTADKTASKFRKIMAAVGGVAAVKKAVELSDNLTQAQGRMKMLTGSDAAASQMNDAIYSLANRSRAGYLDTANFVTNMGANAGVGAKGAFANAEELLRFSESVNKLFVISNTSAEGQKAATLQLTQAMSSGVLRGEELNSVFEQAPQIIQTVADYLDVPLGKIRSMAADGQISADVVKKAMLASANEIDKKFSKMPYTWSQIWTVASNVILRVLTPIFKLISAIAQFVANNWPIIAPIVLGIAAAVGVWLIATKGAAMWTAIVTTATKAWAAAQAVLNAVLALNPVALIIIGIIALIALIAAIINKERQAAGETTSIVGDICGVFAVAGAFIFNAITGTINAVIQMVYSAVAPILSIIEWFLNVAKGGFDSFGDAVGNLIGNIISWFLNLGQIVTKIIDAIFGTNWTAGLEALKGKVLSYGKNKNAITLSQTAPTINRIGYGNAFNSGYNFGEGISNKITGLGDSIGGLLGQAAANTEATAENTGSAASSLKNTNEDLKYLRDLAEQEAINRFTTAEVKIDMTGMTNRISSDMDLDGVLRVLTDGFAEALTVAAEGVHA